eukprot:1036996-Pleurochrysis_carterae.AAC.1
MRRRALASVAGAAAVDLRACFFWRCPLDPLPDAAVSPAPWLSQKPWFLALCATALYESRQR